MRDGAQGKYFVYRHTAEGVEELVFTRLTIDPGRAQGLLMFRLAESLIDVIVHEKVARAIAAGQFSAVALTGVTPE